MKKQNTLWLAVIVTTAFLLRIYFSSLRNILESWDSAAYLWLAKSIHQGDGFRLWPGAPAHTWFQPLYPYMVSAAYSLTGMYEKAGHYVSALFGSLLILPVFLLTRLLFSREAAFIAAVTVIFQVRLVEASSLVLTEMPYAFFWLFGLYFGFRIIIFRHRSIGEFIGCGAFMGVASLIRTESNFDFLVIVGILVFLFLRNEIKKKAPVGISWMHIGALLAAFGVFVVPYMVFLYEQLHLITFTGRTVRSVFAVIQEDNETYEFHSGSPITWALNHPATAIRRIIDNDEYILRKHAIWAFHPIMTFLMALSLFGKPWSNTDVRKMTLFLVFLLLPWVSYYGVSGILNRYYTTSIILVSILAANGIVYLYDWFTRSEAFSRLRNKYPTVTGKAVCYSLAVFVLFLTNIKPLAHPVALGGYPEHGDQLKDYRIGVWIKTSVPLSHPAILCASPRVAYYGEGRFFGDNDKSLTMQTLPAFIAANGINILVVDDFFYEQWFPGLKDLKDQNLAPAYLKCIQAIPYRYDTGKQGVALIYQVINQ